MRENKDIRRALILRGILVILRPILWYALFTAVVLVHIVYGEYKVRVDHPLVYVALVFVVAVPFLMGWITAILKLRAFSGVITKIETDMQLRTSQTMTRSRLKDDHHKWVMYFTVINSRKKIFKKSHFSIYDPSFKDVRYLKVGDHVRHYWGSKYLEKSVKTGDEDVLCIVCGELCRMQQDICYNCRHTLLKKSGYYVSE